MKLSKMIRYGVTMCMLLTIFMLCKAVTVYANSYKTEQSAKKMTYTITDAKKEDVHFGGMSTTGPMYIGGVDTFVIENKSDRILEIETLAATDRAVVLTWNSESGTLVDGQTVDRSSIKLCSGVRVLPGKRTYVKYIFDQEANPQLSGMPQLQIISHVKVIDAVIKKQPKISATKLSADQVSIMIDPNNGAACVRGRSKMNIYKGSKLIKTIKSSGDEKYRYTYKAKGAASGKYKVELVAADNSYDKKMSAVVSPKANVWSRKVSTKLSDYEDFSSGFVIQSLSYSGKNLIVKGYTYNTFGVPMQDYILARANCDGRTLCDESKMMTVPAGIKKYTFTIKNARLVDLRNGDISASDD